MFVKHGYISVLNYKHLTSLQQNITLTAFPYKHNILITSPALALESIQGLQRHCQITITIKKKL